MNSITVLIAVLSLGLTACASVPAPAASAAFVSPSDGDTVTDPFTVVLVAGGIRLAPAGIPATGEAIPGPSDPDEAAGRFHLGNGSDSREIARSPGASIGPVPS